MKKIATVQTTRRLVLRKQIKPDPNQPRKEFDKSKLQELADSFGGSADGILETLKVREENGHFVLVDGERRWRAAELAGFERLPIEVIAPKDVLKTQYIFGTQRENLNALEEAATAQRLLDERKKSNPKFSVEDLGKELGKPRSVIYELLALMKVSQPVREALLAGKLDASKARLFATVSPDLHKKLLEEATDEDWDYSGTAMSVRDLKRHIEDEYARNLNNATFDTKKEFAAMPWVQGGPVKGQKGQLVALPACAACALRSGNIEGWEGSPNICTSVACFDAKTKRHGEELVKEAQKSGQQVVKDDRNVVAADRDTYTKKGWQEWGQLAKAAKVKPALYVDEKSGDVQEVFTADQQKKIRKHHGIRNESSGGDNKELRKFQKKEREFEQVAFVATAQIVNKLTEPGQPWPSKLWVLLADSVARGLRDTGEAFVARQLGLSQKKIGSGELLEAYLTNKERTDRDRQKFILTGLLCMFWNDGGWHQVTWSAEFKDLCQLAGVSLDKVAKSINEWKDMPHT